MARLRGLPEGVNELGYNVYYKPSQVSYRIDKNDDEYEEFLGFENWKNKSKFDSNSLLTNPKLDNSYHLADGSPCIGVGKMLQSLVEKDYDGKARGAKIDIGADQYNNGSSSVSYTHLDVYKRQGLRNPGGCAGACDG